ncbi:histidine phosphatase family protein [Gymnodinialimonas ceratoperidinii]|uniref:Histidine phosphatase family protein n=1 Tax=Gymnodinialimonas ceratoperidinii TaxID=2856823 RepID=A0A8F6TV95_9RHOB|nr:histidine phosphatase family protein [Gymnodinialimonas ceratoperidinii]QXT38519.1 histidine phosphatase family protein [Gymnodinialimonas ceratoperidinii]
MRDLPPLYILRHGQTAWNVEGRFQGRLDAPLTTLGRAQAAQQGRIIAAQILPSPPEPAVRLSPLGRAQTTWHLAAAEANFNAPDVAVDEMLAEVHMGAWQGCLRQDLLPETATPADVFDASVNTPGGETFAELHARLDTFLQRLTGPTICVTHGIASLVLRGLARGLTREQMAGQGYEQGVVYHLQDGQERRLLPPGQI